MDVALGKNQRVDRTKKVIGQLESVLRGLNDDDSCAEVLQRLSAAVRHKLLGTFPRS